MTMSRHGAKRFGMTLCDHAWTQFAGQCQRQRATKLMRIDDEPLVLGNWRSPLRDAADLPGTRTGKPIDSAAPRNHGETIPMVRSHVSTN
jgi:hypothetical protein